MRSRTDGQTVHTSVHTSNPPIESEVWTPSVDALRTTEAGSARGGRRGIGITRRRARCPGEEMAGPVHGSDVAGMINNQYPNEDEQALRDYLLPGALPNYVFSAKSITRLLKRHLDEPVKSGESTLVLRRQRDAHTEVLNYRVVTLS